MKKLLLLLILFLSGLLFTNAQPGTPDSSFGGKGWVAVPLPNASFLNGLAIQSDSKIIVAGSARDVSGHLRFIVARYTINGIPDSTFGLNGKQSTDFGMNDELAASVAIQKNEKIVIGGSIRGGHNPVYNFDTIYFAIARLTSNGSLDSSFSGDGKQTATFGNSVTNVAKSIAIQNNGRIIMAGTARDLASASRFAIARFNNIDGSLDSTFSGDGKQTTVFSTDDNAQAIAVQSDGKIVAAGSSWNGSNYDFAVARYHTDGRADSSFSADGKQTLDFGANRDGVNSIAIQNDGKILLAGGSSSNEIKSDYALARFNYDGSADNTFDGDGKLITDFGYYDNAASVKIQPDGKIVLAGSSNVNFISNIAVARYKSNGQPDSSFGNNGKVITDLGDDERAASAEISNYKLYVTGTNVIAAYRLFGKGQIPPMVNITTPASNSSFISPARIRVIASASDADGAIKKVEFYNGAALLRTETVAPYDFKWQNVSSGNYVLTAKATDNTGLVTTSAPVQLSVVQNKPPTVSIISPLNDQTFAAPAIIHFEAIAGDIDGRVTKVEFYNGTTLLILERKIPYTYHWANVPAGTYTITAVATDNWGAVTTSAPVTVTVASPGTMMVSSRPPGFVHKPGKYNTINMQLAPNPAKDFLMISTTGLPGNERITMSIISTSGVVIKTISSAHLAETLRVNISALAGGVYTIKLLSADKCIYRKFLKL